MLTLKLETSMAKLFEVRVPKSVSFTEWEIYTIEAESAEEAKEKVETGNHNSYPEYEDAGDYETTSVDYSETEVEEITT
jgi:hypothetical protein